MLRLSSRPPLYSVFFGYDHTRGDRWGTYKLDTFRFLLLFVPNAIQLIFNATKVSRPNGLFIANINIPYVFNWTANIVHVINTRTSCAEFQLEFQHTFNCIFTYSFICYYSYRPIVVIKRRYLRRDFINTLHPGYLKVDARSSAYIYIHEYICTYVKCTWGGGNCVYDVHWLLVVLPTELRQL